MVASSLVVPTLREIKLVRVKILFLPINFYSHSHSATFVAPGNSLSQSHTLEHRHQIGDPEGPVSTALIDGSHQQTSFYQFTASPPGLGGAAIGGGNYTGECFYYLGFVINICTEISCTYMH